MADLKISEMPDGGLVQTGDEIPVNRSGANFKVKVGSGATANIGNDVGDVIAWEDDGSGNPLYPAQDGSMITNIQIPDGIFLRKDEPVVTATITGTYNIDFNAGQTWYLTATGDCNIDIINPPSGGASIPVKIVQDSTPRVIDFIISGLSWANGSVPIMPSTGGDYIWVLFVTDDGGTTWTGFDCGLVEP